MDMVMGIVDSYGYSEMLAGVAGYHLFPDFVSGKNEDMRRNGMLQSKKVPGEIMRIRGESDFLAGDTPSLSDFYLAPICFYVSLTDDAAELFADDRFSDWWQRIQQLSSYRNTEPDLGG